MLAPLVCLSLGVFSFLSGAVGEFRKQQEVGLNNLISTDRFDLLELCCPGDSQLTARCLGAGGKCQRMGLHNGFDLSKTLALDDPEPTASLVDLVPLRPFQSYPRS